MLESIYKLPFVRARHLSAPFLEERSRYLIHLQQQGNSVRSLRETAAMLLNIVEHLDLEAPKIDQSAVERASKQWAKSGYSRLGNFRASAHGWLRFQGVLTVAPPPNYPYGDILPEYLRSISSMTPTTQAGYRSRAFRFLSWATTRRENFSAVTLTDINDYFIALRDAGLKVGYVFAVCQTLRSLFKFAESKGWIQTPISKGIFALTPPKYDPNPRGPRWSEVRRMLSTQNRSDIIGLRANAVLCLLAIYGLRSVEVRSLKLDDVDFDEKTLYIKRAKGGRIQRFPLAPEVEVALRLYLAQRPDCICRSFFVTRSPPFRAMAHKSVLDIVAARMRRLQIKSPVYGTHALRHSCATELLRKGVSLDDIARFLGHRDNKTVTVYAKCSRGSVREVANFSLAGIL